MAKKGGLGKGLDAIFYDNAREDDAGAVELSINDLEPNRTQPRQSFDDGAMTELADSIAQHGVLQRRPPEHLPGRIILNGRWLRALHVNGTNIGQAGDAVQSKFFRRD